MGILTTLGEIERKIKNHELVTLVDKRKETSVSKYQPNTTCVDGVAYRLVRSHLTSVTLTKDGKFYVGYTPVDSCHGKWGYTIVGNGEWDTEIRD